MIYLKYLQIPQNKKKMFENYIMYRKYDEITIWRKFQTLIKNITFRKTFFLLNIEILMKNIFISFQIMEYRTFIYKINF